MPTDPEIEAFLRTHLNAIQGNDIATYKATTSEDLSLYEWWITPHRIDGVDFHEFMMRSNAERGAVFGAEHPAGPDPEIQTTRFDLANLRIQRYGDTAIASYTLLTSSATEVGVNVVAHQESRVIVRDQGRWRVVHVHKSPAWPAPHIAPQS